MKTWKGDAATASAKHAWLNKHFPRAGICRACGAPGKTHYAFLKHPEPHTRIVDDYAELCPACHGRLDQKKRILTRTLVIARIAGDA